MAAVAHRLQKGVVGIGHPPRLQIPEHHAYRLDFQHLFQLGITLAQSHLGLFVSADIRH